MGGPAGEGRRTAKSTTSPGGAEIYHQILDVTSEAGAIDRGYPVEVIKTEDGTLSSANRR